VNRVRVYCGGRLVWVVQLVSGRWVCEGCGDYHSNVVW
jgi:hypothetical protein